MEKLPKARNEMDVPKTEEKELTAKDILETVEKLKTGECDVEVGKMVVLPYQALCNVIHRLQAENEQLKCDTYKTSWKGKFFEAKKEIERLTEKNNEIFQRYLNVIDKNNDLQNQVDKVEAEKEDLYRSNERLQKQVDELKTRDMSEMRDLFNNETDRLIEKAHQQAVKDTAKKIERELEDKGYFEYGKFTISGNDFIEIFKKHGVEVKQ